MVTRIIRWLLLAAIVGVALGLRTSQLGRRPMHADEANQAVKTGTLLDTGVYRFDPADHHGPTLYFAAVPIAWMRGESSLAHLSEVTVRLVPAFAGVVAVLLLGLLGPAVSSRWLVAAGLLAVLPPAVYYARDFIQETLLTTFLLLTVWAAVRWWTTGALGWALLAGTAAGLMLATKETAVLLLGTVAVAGLAARPSRPAAARPLRHAVGAALAALAVAAVLYSSFGRNPAGLIDAFVAPWNGLQRATGHTGHEKPWWYYLQLLTFVRQGGLTWHHVPFLVLVSAGVIAAIREREGWTRAAAVFAGLLLLALCAVPYKTPWNVIPLLPPLCLLAASGGGFIARFRFGKVLASALLLLVLGSLLQQTRLVVFQRPADARNPWAYVHSSPDVTKFRALVTEALARTPQQPVRVISEEYWPLPWYLRGLPRVGYWSTPPEDCDGALVIASAGQAESVAARLHGSYQQSFLGLRPGFVCVVFTPSP